MYCNAKQMHLVLLQRLGISRAKLLWQNPQLVLSKRELKPLNP